MTSKQKTSPSSVIFSDYPDPDVIRDGNTYYMASTTMYYMPGCAILRSYNLVDWELYSYVFDTLDDTPGQKLEDGKGIYGQGMWAPCLRKHENRWYVCFVCNDTHRTYLYQADSPKGPWKKSYISGFYHDMSLLFDDDGRIFAVHGNRNIHLTELRQDLTGPKEGTQDRIIIQDSPDAMLGYEGSHIYRINGKYYIFLIHWQKDGLRTEACFMADQIEGPYKGKDVLSAPYLGWNSGVAQGGIVDDGNGNWYGMLFQDHGALGRMPVIVPVEWGNDGFPVFGRNGTVPESITTTDFSPDHEYEPLWTDSFTDDATGRMKLQWQFSHNPDPALYSFHQKDGKQYFTIKSGLISKNPCLSKNLLTQRPFTEHCSAVVRVDASALKEGDHAGLIAFEGEYGFISITKKNGKYYVETGERKEPATFRIGDTDTDCPLMTQEVETSSSEVMFQLVMNLSENTQEAEFMWSTDGNNYSIMAKKKLRFTLDHFTGCRIGLFLYSTKNTGGKASFSDFSYILQP